MQPSLAFDQETDLPHTASHQEPIPVARRVLVRSANSSRLFDHVPNNSSMTVEHSESDEIFREESIKSLNIPRPEYAVPRPVGRPSLEGARLVQQWEGTVVDVLPQMLIARLRDLLHQQRPEERAEIPLAQVSEPDLPLVSTGAVFYWTVGYRISPSGQRTLASDIRFRRDPCWSESDLRRIEMRERELDELLGEPSAQ